VIYSRDYQLPMPGVHHDPRRGEKVVAWLAERRLLRAGALHRPHPVSLQALRRVHDEAYLDALREPEVFTRIVGVPLSPIHQDRLLAVQRAMTGGTQLATRLALSTGRTAFNLGGGLHHAFRDHGERLCLFNDVAVAIATERVRGFRGRVLVVDLDLHDGDGTRSLFAADPTVHTYSIHNQTNGAEDAVEATILELGTGIGDQRYLEVLERTLPPLVERFAPQLVFYLAGVDPAADDALGDWELSPAGLLARDRRVVETLRRRAPAAALVIVLAGGYGPDVWRYSARFAAWLARGREVPLPPTQEEVALARYRHLARRLAPAELTADDDTTFELTADDVLAGLAGPPRPTRFLGYYSAHGIELTLERAGILDRIRDLGFAHPTLDLDLANPGGETLRLFGDAEKTELLMELRARRDRRVVPGMELLRVEWMLLQNPRASFGPDRRPLPGQRHPGLGMLTDVISLLVLVCDRLHLDGVFFVPSHYHLAAQSRRFLRFLEPEDEARFRAFRAALDPLPLLEATRAVEAGRVVDPATGQPVPWHPAPMLIPVSPRLEQQVAGEDYERRVREARDRFCFAVAR
jgi:acetoin utilization deacetylase AcuC-like enzyme